MPAQNSHKDINHSSHAKDVYNATFSEYTAKAQKPQIKSYYFNPIHDTLTVKYDPNIFKTHVKIAASDFEKTRFCWLDSVTTTMTLIRITLTLAPVSSVSLSTPVIFHFCFLMRILSISQLASSHRTTKPSWP
jgi:hypothetical protein